LKLKWKDILTVSVNILYPCDLISSWLSSMSMVSSVSSKGFWKLLPKGGNC
jgi:hypothetical protein